RDGRDGEVAIGDGGDDALGQVHGRDMDRVADVEAGQVDLEVLGNPVGGNGHLDRVAHDVEHGALPEAGRLLLVDEVHRHVNHEIGVLAHAQEIHMHEEIAHGLKLVILWDHAVLLAIDLDGDDAGQEAAVMDLAEGVLVGHGDGKRGFLVAVDNGRYQTIAAQFTSGPLAHPVPHRSLQLSAHGN